MVNQPTILDRMIDRLASSKHDVFFRKDFTDLGSYSQIGRCLRQLCDDQKLIRIGLGIYAKTTIYPDHPFAGEVLLCDYLPYLARAALTRMGIEVAPSQADRDYASGQSTQVPTGKVLGIRGQKITRRIGHNGFYVDYDYVN
jgi:hypothetical protein